MGFGAVFAAVFAAAVGFGVWVGRAGVDAGAVTGVAAETGNAVFAVFATVFAGTVVVSTATGAAGGTSVDIAPLDQI